MARPKSWIGDEDNLITKLWIDGFNAKEIQSKIPNRTLEAVRSRIRRLRLNNIYPHSTLIDLSEKKFGRLLVKERYFGTDNRHTQWLCDCDCGRKNVVVYGQSLKSGVQVSCGCWMREINSKKHIFKGNTYDLSGEYGIGYCSNNGKEFYFDLEDYEKIKPYTWREDAHGYIVTNDYIGGDGRKIILMHRFLFDLTPDDKTEVDHINHNTNDNRKNRLRITNHMQNHQNIAPKNNEVCGLSYDKKCDTWYVTLVYNRKTIHLGSYKNKQEAIKARIKAEQEYYGEYAYSYSQKIGD